MGFEPLGLAASLQPRWDSPLDIFIIPHFLWFVKRFFNFFENFLHHPVAHSLTLGVMVSIPLDIVIIPHPRVKYNSQSIQNWENNLINFCTTFLLTNGWRGSIMEISRARSGDARLKNENEKVRGCPHSFSFSFLNFSMRASNSSSEINI